MPIPFSESNTVTNMMELLRYRAQNNPFKNAYNFLENGEEISDSLTYAELDLKARAMAAKLQALSLDKSTKALLLFPPGLDVIIAFFGCLYAGIVAIPAPPPDAIRAKRTLPRLKAIIDDSKASIILAPTKINALLEQASADMGITINHYIHPNQVDEAFAADWQIPQISSEHLAYLQYTSGSTSTPKGVMISHGNLLHHSAVLKNAWNYQNDSSSITWVPYFHDYGLVDGLIQPLYSGIPCYVMSPLSFLKQPVRWLKAISHYGITHTQGPNFAYDHCNAKITEKQCEGLNLSSLQTASIAAEPIRPGTVRAFIEKFAPFGFASQALYPAYGLAEATLVVSTKPHGKDLVIDCLNANDYEKNKIVIAKPGQKNRQVTSCGTITLGMDVQIVDPGTRNQCPELGVGEIWVKDPSIALGYLNRPKETTETFQAQIANNNHGPYMRTGDLGYMRGNQLYITGRLKDLIIINGVNHYPQDVEITVETCHQAVRQNNCAAFSVDIDGSEKMIIACEVDRKFKDYDQVLGAIRQAVRQAHEVDVYGINLLKTGGMLKTSSGKIQRQKCRLAYQQDQLVTIACFEQPKSAEQIIIPSDILSKIELNNQEQGPERLVEEWLYQLSWLQKSRKTPISEQQGDKGKWLIFADSTGYGQELADQLISAGNQVVLAYSAYDYSKIRNNEYQLSPAAPDHFQRLFADCFQGITCSGIIHLWSLNNPKKPSYANLKASIDRGCGSILHTVQAFCNEEGIGNPRLWLLTQGAQPINSATLDMSIGQSALWGMSNNIHFEYPGLQCVLIDLDPNQRYGVFARQVELIFDEITHPSKECHIGFRQGKRYVQRFHHYSTLKGNHSINHPPQIKTDAAYLITGGLGAIGLNVANMLIDLGAKHIVLIGRSKLDKLALTKIKALENRGGNIGYFAADCADYDTLKEVFQTIKTEFPPLKGIMHAAGILDDGVLLYQNLERFHMVMRPKIFGTWNLHEFTCDMNLDFFNCFSSLAAILTSPGQVSYGAANSFLDAFAYYRRELGLPCQSVNWGLWAEDGMASKAPAPWKDRITQMGILPMSSAKAIAICQMLLGINESQMVVSPFNWQQFGGNFKGDNIPPYFSLVCKSSSAESVKRSIPPCHNNLEQLSQYILARTAKLLNIQPENINLDDNLFEVGIDSLMAIELPLLIEQDIGLKLPTDLLFEYPSINQMLVFLAEKSKAALTEAA